jgi:hypothetical protein
MTRRQKRLKRQRESMAALWKFRVENYLCPQCGEKKERDRLTCPKHSEANRVRMRKKLGLKEFRVEGANVS